MTSPRSFYVYSRQKCDGARHVFFALALGLLLTACRKPIAAEADRGEARRLNEWCALLCQPHAWEQRHDPRWRSGVCVCRGPAVSP